MIDFANVRNIVIPEGEVAVIACGAEILWQKSRLPPAYQEVAYLESTGTQWIDTAYCPTGNTKIEAEVPDGEGDFYAAISSGYRYGIYVIAGGRLDVGYPSIGYKGQVITGETYPAVATLENGIATLNDSVYTFNGRDFTMPISLTPFAQNTNSGAQPVAGKCRYFKIYESGELLHHFVPCYRKSDNKGGLYDLVTATFFTNAGTGEFLYG